MKSKAILVNCARGAIVDEDDLYEALMNKKLFSAALDVLKRASQRNKLLELETY